jgi:serine/threonine-protein kinase
VAAALQDADLPRRFGRYVLFDQIGEGGMARIYLGATETDLGGQRLVVVKQILPLLAQGPDFAGLLIEEAKLAAQLSHKNVVQVFDLGRENDILYIAMEYVEGFDLRELLRQCSQAKVPLPIEFSLLVVIETLRGLDYAHRKRGDDGQPLQIVHRDVSPSNVLTSFEGEVKLCDFGIARAIGASGALPEAAIQGKAGYMSPEAAAGMPIDARADLFAAGVILWELIAGRRLYRSAAGRPPSLEQAREALIPALPARGYPDEPELHAIVMRALEKDPDRRYRSARDMHQALERWVASAGLGASPLRFGEWLLEHFGQQMLVRRRARERVALAGAEDERRSDALPPPADHEAPEHVEVPRMQPPTPSLERLAQGRSVTGPRAAVTALLVALLVALIVATAYLMR